MTAAGISTSARYRFGDSRPAGLLLGFTLRQALPLVIGVLFLTLCLMAQLPLIGMLGPIAGVVLAFGRWRRAPLHEVAVPGVRLAAARRRHREAWVRGQLLGAGPGLDDELPPALAGLQLLSTAADWLVGQPDVAIIRDRTAGTVSMAIPVVGQGFPVASLREQDALVANWGAALAPLARPRCPVNRVTWQEWSHPAGVDGHREFLGGLIRPATSASVDYDELLAVQSPFTIAHEVLLTVTVDLRRVRARRGVPATTAGIEVVGDEVRLLCSRLEAAGLKPGAPLSPGELSAAVRLRSDPSRARQVDTLRRSLAASVGRGAIEWGPMAVAAAWNHVAVDGSMHRSYRVAGWPMLPVTADWLAPLLTGDAATRTVTVVLEPVPLGQAAQDANRQLTSIEADQQQKERHGFRLTARERRRHADVETRERELAEGHPLFRHVGIVTVTAADLDGLDDAAAQVEQAAAQSMLDLRPLAARQGEGWAAALPLGRSVRAGNWR